MAVPSAALKKRLRDCRVFHQTDLDLSNLSIDEVPVDALTGLSSLRALNLSRNMLQTFPGNFYPSFLQLTSLNLSCNELSYLTEQIGRLEGLQCLNLANNSLSVLPSTLNQLKNLTELYLQYNQLTVLRADTFEGLNKLRVMNIAHNYIQRIPDTITELKMLQVVDITGTDTIAGLPLKIQYLQEQNKIYHSKLKRKELISRALGRRPLIASALPLKIFIAPQG